MKTTDKTNTNTPNTSIETPVAIDSAALDDVTGGCGACGRTCELGAAPAAANGQRLPWQPAV
jgi:hypothetical protein